MMRRREFVAGLGAAPAAPIVVRAQQDRTRRIGVLLSYGAQAANAVTITATPDR
jgi:hypothetical protein